MFDWIKLGIVLLQLVNVLLEKGRRQRDLTEGEDREIARQNAEMLRRSQRARQILAETEQLSESALDGLLRELGESAERGNSK